MNKFGVCAAVAMALIVVASATEQRQSGPQCSSETALDYQRNSGEHAGSEGAVAPTPHQEPVNIATALGWQAQPDALCHGQFTAPNVLADVPQLTIETQGPAKIQRTGQSIFQGPILARYHQQKIQAQTLCLQDASKRKGPLVLDKATLYAPFGQIVGQTAQWDVGHDQLQFWQLAYRYQSPNTQGHVIWGQARTALRDPKGQIHLHDATLSTCPITQPTWQLRAHSVTINPTTERIALHRIGLLIYGHRVALWPYLSFPSDGKRHSGWLVPKWTYSNVGGAMVRLPYYWNIAPAMDAVITPMISPQRGLGLTTQWRGLHPKGSGQISTLWLPHDDYFYHQQQRLDPLHAQLQRLGWVASGYWKPSSISRIDATSHWVSDDNIPDDFRHWFGPTSYLLDNQLQWTVATSHIKSIWRVLGYQRLQPIGRDAVPLLYNRLPEWIVQVTQPLNNQTHRWRWSLGYEHALTQFYDPRSGHWPLQSGRRFWLEPWVEASAQTVAHQWQLRLAWALRGYRHLQGQAPGQMPTQQTPKMAMHWTWGALAQGTQMQTSLWLRYAPYRPQQGGPNFDSALQQYSIDTLARDRFIGHDYLPDMADVVAQWQGRWRVPYTQLAKTRVTLANQTVWQKHRVCVASLCQFDWNARDYVGPILAQWALEHPTWGRLETEWGLDVHRGRWIRRSINVVHDWTHQSLQFSIARSNLTPPEVGQSMTSIMSDHQIRGRWQATLPAQWTVGFETAYQRFQERSLSQAIDLGFKSCCWAFTLKVGQDRHGPRLTKPQKIRYNGALSLELLGLGT